MSIPRGNEKREFEQLEVDVMLPGVIVAVEEEQDHLFKGYTKKDGTTVAERHVDAVRFVFEFEGYKSRHYSRWMTFSYDDRSNLFTKYLKPLVAGIEPYAEFDIQQLVGMQIQATWGQKKDSSFQNIETIIPLGKKMVATFGEPEANPLPSDEDAQGEDTEVPF